MILGSCTGRPSLPTPVGIPCPGFIGVGSDSPLESVLVSVSLEDLDGAGGTGDMTGMTPTEPTSPSRSSLTATLLLAADSITRPSAAVASVMAALVAAADSTDLPPFTLSAGRAP